MKRPSPRIRRSLALFAGFFLLFLLYRTLSRTHVRYAIRGVAMDQGTSSVAMDINNQGDVAGTIGRNRVFVDRNGSLVAYTVDTGGFVEIDNQGDLLHHTPDTVALWHDGRPRNLVAFGRTIIGGRLRDDGVVVGEVDLDRYTRKIVLWREGRATGLTYVSGGPYLFGIWDVSASGIIVGNSGSRQVAWRAGKTWVLPTPIGYHQSSAHAVNSSGQIVGVCYRTTLSGVPSSAVFRRACLWENGSVHLLGSPVKNNSATDINEQGQVIGTSDVRANYRINWRAWRTPKLMLQYELVSHATLFETGKALDLNDLIPPGSGWTLEEAFAINDKGQIVGTGRYRGNQRGFVLTPVKTPQG